MPHSLDSDSTVTVGHYELRKCLGSGGFGQVYEAWDQLLYRPVALKCLSVAPGSGDKLISEARLAASLQHLAFVKVFGFEDDGRFQYIVMELVRGATLRHHVAEVALDPKRALDITGRIAAAMVEAHESGLIHGDLKPGNLMLEPGGAVRILDFGLARHIDPMATESGPIGDPQGTIAYMAPERLAGHAPTASSDIYALGVVLYELTAGERPFPGLNGMALATAQLQTSSQQWQFPAGIDQGLLQLILAMTARDPLVRLPSMRAVCARIAELGATVTLPLPPAAAPPPRTGTPAWPARRWARPLAGALGVAALVAAVVLAPRAWDAATALPYSEAAAMQAGLAALQRSDRDGALDAALGHFDGILERNQRHAGAAAGQSIAYSMQYIGNGRDETLLQRAEVAARLALQENDQLALAHAAQAWVHALQGRGNDALAAADRALALDPNSVPALNAKINTLLRLQRHAEARTLVDSARARLPRERVLADLDGTLHYQKGDYKAAEQAFRRSVALEPDAVLAYANLSGSLVRQGRRDDALHVLQQGLAVQPNGVLYTNLGTALFERGDYLGAAKAFEHAVSAARGGPNTYLRWANLADTLRWIPGRQQDSVDAYRRAMQLLRPRLERSPNDATFLTRMGLYAAHLPDEPGALAWSERGAAAAPDNPDVRYRAALANELGGRRDAALAHLARAVALGYPFSSIESEPDLVALRRDARYQTLAMENAK